VLAFNVLMTALLALVVRPGSEALFWIVAIAGFWTISLVSDLSAVPRTLPLLDLDDVLHFAR
jgi:hypothetical protein